MAMTGPSIMAPIHSLPVELITSVFLTCIREFGMPPEIFCELDQRLREICLSAPSLWTDISFSGLPDEAPRLLRFLELSAASCISLRLELPQAYFAGEFIAKWLSEVLAPHLSRVRVLHIATREVLEHEDPVLLRGGVGEATIRMFLASFNYGAPALEELVLDLPALKAPPLEFLLCRAPRLRSVTTTSVYTQDIHDVFMQSASITDVHIDLSCAPDLGLPQGLIDVLAELPALRRLIMQVPDESRVPVEGVQPHSRRTFTGLSSLQLDMRSFGMLSYFHGPMLQRLSVEGSVLDRMPMHLGPFLELHRMTLVSIDVRVLHDQARSSHPAVDRGVQRLDFPVLESLTASLRCSMGSTFLRMVGGAALREIWLELEQDEISTEDVVEFFEATSATVQKISITERMNSGIDTEAFPTTLRITYPCLITFSSGSRLGDKVFAATKAARNLRELHLHGEPNVSDYDTHPERIYENRDIHLPGLQRLVAQEFSPVLRRIHAPQLKMFVACSSVAELQARWAVYGSKLRESGLSPPWVKSRDGLLLFVMFHADSLETLLLHDVISTDHPESSPHPLFAPRRRHFPCLKTIMLHPSDSLGEWIVAPRLEVLEFIDPLFRFPVHCGLWGFSSAHTLKIGRMVKISSLMTALYYLPNVTRVRLRVDLETCGSSVSRPSPFTELRFLRRLSHTANFSGDFDTAHESVTNHRWILPRLTSLELHIATELPQGSSAYLWRWYPKYDKDTASEASDDSLDNRVLSDSDDDESLTDDHQGSLSDSQVEGSKSQDSIRRDDAAIEDLFWAGTTQPVEVTPPSARAHPVVATEPVVPKSTLPDDPRVLYRRLIHRLKGMIAARRDSLEAENIQSVVITTDDEVHYDFSVPGREWFESVLDSFEAPEPEYMGEGEEEDDWYDEATSSET